MIVSPREPQLMYVEWYNHWPLGKKLARDTEVRWGEKAGVQVGELVLVTERGFERLHSVDRALFRVG